jgi:short-subunit dehydrogenase
MMENKVVLVTGASSGIGKATALRLAPAGTHLVLTYHRRQKEAEEVRAACLKRGAKDVTVLKLNVCNDKNIIMAFEEVRQKHPEINVLVNNAGTGIVKPFSGHSFAEIERQLRTNLEGLIKMTHVFLPLVTEWVVNIGSMLAKETIVDMAVYCASKFGVRGFTQALAREVPALKFCCLNPDMTATPLTQNHGRPPEAVADVLWKVLTGEIACPTGGDVDVWQVPGPG